MKPNTVDLKDRQDAAWIREAFGIEGRTMPGQKFRSIEAMKATPPPDRGISLQKRIAGILARSAAFLPPFERPKGVFKLRTIEEM
jgi:hypothetical protein